MERESYLVNASRYLIRHDLIILSFEQMSFGRHYTSAVCVKLLAQILGQENVFFCVWETSSNDSAFFLQH